jgi:hypothetical protein
VRGCLPDEYWFRLTPWAAQDGIEKTVPYVQVNDALVVNKRAFIAPWTFARNPAEVERYGLDPVYSGPGRFSISPPPGFIAPRSLFAYPRTFLMQARWMLLRRCW